MNLEVINDITSKNFVSSIENLNVEKLFNIVNNYVKINYVCELNEKYYVSYDNNNYEIGMIYGPEDILYYIRKSNIEANINLVDVLNNKLSNNMKIIRDRINTINEMISSLHQDGVSLSLIKKSIKFN